MQVRVRFLSHLSSLVGAKQVEVSLPAPASLADLKLRLQAMFPEHANLLAHLAYMVDEKNATPETQLADGAQVLALMLLSGG